MLSIKFSRIEILIYSNENEPEMQPLGSTVVQKE